MKSIIFQLFVFSTVFTVFLGCQSTDQPLPPLTYSGTEPRVQDPLSPEDSRLHIQVPEGFEVELFAAEPNIINPIAFTWDERGRLYVVQSQDYPHELANEVGGDRITICEDTDGDGKADKFTDFATEQSLTTGITVVKGGIIVSQAPNMVFLEDRDGDDKMDHSTVLFDGFGTWDTHAGPSSLRYGLDNMLWGAVGYSGFEGKFIDRDITFKMGVYRFSKDGRFFEPVGQFNNNTWGLGFSENFEIFGSTANNNHACYVGIPLKHYQYLDKLPKWALNADFIQGHYEITTVDTIPLQQVDVRGGFTAAAGANFYTARNFPEEYWNQMLVNEPTGHVVHLAKIVQSGAGYVEEDGGNIFASTDAWTAPVFSETGPDGNIWVADWYNPVIQHNPDRRGMDNQIWNDIKGEGNAHINNLRDKRHGRIYVLKPKRGKKQKIKSLSPNDGEELLNALHSDNMFWRTTAQRLIVENQLTDLIPDLMTIAGNEDDIDKTGFNPSALHALYSLDGLNALEETNAEAMNLLKKSLSNDSYAVVVAAIDLLPISMEGSQMLAESQCLQSEDLRIRLKALLKAGDLPETVELFQSLQGMDLASEEEDKWMPAARKVYHRTMNTEDVDPQSVVMLMPSAEEGSFNWKYTFTQPADNWQEEGFNDGSWKSGKAVFGGGDDVDKQTTWTGTDIWMRTDFYLDDVDLDLVLKYIHDNNFEVYVNGSLLLSSGSVQSSYKYHKLDSDKMDLFKKGKNTIAVYCHDKGGNRYIDLGIGKVGKLKADVVFHLNTVSQKMAYDKTVLKASAGQVVELVLNNEDEMSHNLVVIEPGSTEAFGVMVDEFMKNPEAEKMGYVPGSKYVISATGMLAPGESESITFKLPDIPGIYPFLCTFPGHWRMMQGVIVVDAPGSYISSRTEAIQISIMGGGGSHNFLKYFGEADGKVLSDNGNNNVYYTEDGQQLREWLRTTDVLFLSNNKPFDRETKNLLMSRIKSGEMNALIYHPSTWYNWKDWPDYNLEWVGGGSSSHEKLGEFEVEVVQPNHPIMKNVPAKFRIIDELYRWKADPQGSEIEVLAIGRGLESGEEFPVVWTVKHPNARIVANTLGHDDRAHGLDAYKTILKNSLDYVIKK
ncbi:PVC-type heme-binding CxxCH protein [Membranihabitans marinus]|uniref:PVC-type heme-binding CxxCH protein n=1 Tax=Membranihabitans marinus TaxID=1227546 RepID=UPI001F28F9D1|nr:PVC-type heme-binding CxxCH protein [Membranihabitans marinus]